MKAQMEQVVDIIPAVACYAAAFEIYPALLAKTLRSCRGVTVK